MKTLIAAAAAALALTAPAFAAQVSDVEAHFASDFTSNDAKIYDGVDAPANAVALELHAGLYAEDETNNNGVALSGEDFIVSTKSVANDTAAQILSDLAAENRNRD